MTRKEALRRLLKAPKHTLKYRGSGFGNPLASRLSQNGLIELKNEWGPERSPPSRRHETHTSLSSSTTVSVCTMKLTFMGEIIAREK
jgi:hypothetical protein